MPCPEITPIQSSECIGNSLVTINGNFESLKTAICDFQVETGVTLEDEGTQIGTNIGTLNFVGAGVNAIVNGNRSQINIPGFEQVKVNRLEEQGINSGGGRNNFFILNDGSLRSCGQNLYGETGTGFADRRVYTPRIAAFNPPLELGEGINKVHSQNNCTYVITTYGRVYGAGANIQGQLGLGKTTKNVPVFTFINVVGETLTPINTSDNPVLGYAAAKLSGNKITQITTGSGSYWAQITIFALTEDGRIFVWGANGRGQASVPIANTGNIIASPIPASGFAGQARLITSAGNQNATTTFAVDTNDKLYVVGRNQSGQAGIGSNDTANRDIKSFRLITGLPSAYRVNNVRVGGTADKITTLVTLKDGTLWAAGQNVSGICSGTADSTPSTFISFSRVQGFFDTDFVEDVVAHIDSNSSCAWALIRDGQDGYRLKCWGDNSFGQLGLGGGKKPLKLTAVTMNPDWPWLRAGYKVKQVVVAGNGYQKTSLVLDTNNNLWAAGFGATGLIGNGTTNQTNLSFQRVLFNPALGYPVQIRSTNNDVNRYPNFLALLNTGKVLGWGYDGEGSGQLGVDAAPDITTIPSLVQILI